MELGFLISPRKDNTAIAVLLPLEQALLWSLRNDPAETLALLIVNAWPYTIWHSQQNLMQCKDQAQHRVRAG